MENNIDMNVLESHLEQYLRSIPTSQEISVKATMAHLASVMKCTLKERKREIKEMIHECLARLEEEEAQQQKEDDSADEVISRSVKKAKTEPALPQFVELDKKGMRRVSASTYGRVTRVDIREYYRDGDEVRPGRKGLSLTSDQWEKLKESIPLIDKMFEAERARQ